MEKIKTIKVFYGMINSPQTIKGENNMVQEQYTTKRRKGQHLKLIERGKIEALLKIGMSKVKIAEELGISVRTLKGVWWSF